MVRVVRLIRARRSLVVAMFGVLVFVAISAFVVDQSTRPRTYFSRHQILQQSTAGEVTNFRVAVKLMHLSDIERVYPNFCCSRFEHGIDLVWVVAVAHGFTYSCPYGGSCDWSKLNWGVEVIWDAPNSGIRSSNTSGIDSEHWPPLFDSLPDLSAPFGGVFYRALKSQVQSQGLINLQHDRPGDQADRRAQTFDRYRPYLLSLGL